MDEQNKNKGSVQTVLEKYGQNYLVLDGRIQSLSHSLVRDEFRLYNLGAETHNKVIGLFNQITGKSINEKTPIGELSGGQSLILSALIALESQAMSIIFVDYFLPLHKTKRRVIMELLEKYRKQKNIRIVNS